MLAPVFSQGHLTTTTTAAELELAFDLEFVLVGAESLIVTDLVLHA
jgi:hypothetical protein